MISANRSLPARQARSVRTRRDPLPLRRGENRGARAEHRENILVSVRRPLRAQGGFSLLEALIALVVIMIGLLGVAGLQALGIHSSAQAYLRTVAALDAHGLAASMRANHAYWAGFPVPPTITVKAGAASTAATVAPVLATTTNCATGTCTAGETAYYDLRQWGSQLAAMQHSAKATITRIATMGDSAGAYKVTVSWSERRIKRSTKPIAAPATGTTHSTTIVVQP